MAVQGTANGEALVFKFGDGGAPAEAFTESCSINTDRALDLSSEVYQAMLADCADPTKPNIVVRRVKSTDVKFTGSGLADPASAKKLVQLWAAGLPFNGKAIQDLGVGVGFTFTCAWVIESIKMGGVRKELQQFDIGLAAAGPVVVTYQ